MGQTQSEGAGEGVEEKLNFGQLVGPLLARHGLVERDNHSMPIGEIASQLKDSTLVHLLPEGFRLKADAGEARDKSVEHNDEILQTLLNSFMDKFPGKHFPQKFKMMCQR